MKNSASFFLFLVIILFFGSCKTVVFEEPTERQIIPDDNPPVALKGPDSQFRNPTDVYICLKDFEVMDLVNTIPCTYWYQEYDGINTIERNWKYKIRGRINFGFYLGNLHIANSYVEYAIAPEILKKIVPLIGKDKRGYAIGKRCVDSSTYLGLAIYDVQ